MVQKVHFRKKLSSCKIENLKSITVNRIAIPEGMIKAIIPDDIRTIFLVNAIFLKLC
jgi:hypothetical protein